jgi:hypothetical protein
MNRNATAAFVAALSDQDLRPVIFFEGEFASGWVRLWSGLGDVSGNAAQSGRALTHRTDTAYSRLR